MKLLIFALLTSFLIITCDSANIDENEPVTQILMPELTGDGWEVASLNSAGLNETKFKELINRLNTTSNHRIHSILVARHGKLVFEKYYPGAKFNLGQFTGEYGYSINDLHVLCSATKSITSALLGIAMDLGYIQSVDQKVFDFFPEYSSILSESPSKGNMTIKHLLTMTSGLTYDDESLPYTDSRNDMTRFFVSSDPIGFLLSKPLFAEPGTVFDYDNCNTNILGRIISKAVNKRIDQFAAEFLFGKLGIRQCEWQIVRGDVILCSGDLHLRPRDMAKFGQLFLNNGIWEGEDVISSGWCGISTSASLNPNNYNNEFTWAGGYGYQWWQKTFYSGSKSYPSYFAAGWGGQHIFIIPSLNMIIVTTAGNWYDPEIISPFTIVSDYIIPSVK